MLYYCQVCLLDIVSQIPGISLIFSALPYPFQPVPVYCIRPRTCALVPDPVQPSQILYSCPRPCTAVLDSVLPSQIRYSRASQIQYSRASQILYSRPRSGLTAINKVSESIDEFVFRLYSKRTMCLYNCVHSPLGRVPVCTHDCKLFYNVLKGIWQWKELLWSDKHRLSTQHKAGSCHCTQKQYRGPEQTHPHINFKLKYV